jgi:hypothetical protein
MPEVSAEGLAMRRKPTTNPKIDGQPMSFVRLKSTFETGLRLTVPDKDGNMVRKYIQDERAQSREW